MWFLIFLHLNQFPIPMDNYGACVTAAAGYSDRLETTVSCLSPETGEHIIFTNGVMEPHPKVSR